MAAVDVANVDLGQCSMAKKQRFGMCRVCRTPNVKLTFEHVPPRSSFNDVPAETFGLMDYLKRGDEGLMGGRISQRGAGEWSLCKECNEKTGTWYVRELGRATRAAARVLDELPLGELDANPAQEVVRVKFTGAGRRPRPLRFVKQMITMLLAMSPAELSLAIRNLATSSATASGPVCRIVAVLDGSEEFSIMMSG